MRFAQLLLVVMSLGAPKFALAQEFIVRFVNEADKTAAENTLNHYGFLSVDRIPQLNMMVARPVGKGRPDTEGLKKAAGVLYVEPNYVRRAIAVPNDKNFQKQKGMKTMQIEKAWDFNQGSRSVVVAVIDTGLFLNHTDLKNQLWVNPGEIPGNGIDEDGNGYVDDVHGWDFANRDNNPNDDQSHGSHCAGIIGAEANNGVGIAGVAWNVQLMALKFLNSAGSGSDADAIKSIIYAVDNGADIINASWGSPEFSQALLEAVQYANDKGVLFVAAAGNSKANAETRPHYPSGYDTPNMLAVGAATEMKGKADFSNYGRTRVHLAAPGVKIFSTVNGKNTYGSKSGTSMAAPMVAGVAALVLSAQPSLRGRPAHLRNALLNATEPVKGWAGKNATDGFLRADWALEQLNAGAQLWPRSLRFGIGSSTQLTAYGFDRPKFASSDASVVAVDVKGVVTALKPGVTMIAVSDLSGVTRTVQLEVSDNKK